jgi:hypothetical protein
LKDLVVEGPDGSGKTTLVRYLSAQTGLHPVKLSQALTGPVEDLCLETSRYLLSPDRHLFDRHPLFSELIYGHIIRGEVKPGFDDFNWIVWATEKLSERLKTLIVCLPPLSIVKQNLAKSPQMPGVEEHIEQIYDRYVDLVEFEWKDVIVYDYSSKTGRFIDDETFFAEEGVWVEVQRRGW